MGRRSSLGAAQFLKAARPGLRKGEEAHVPGEQPTAKKKTGWSRLYRRASTRCADGLQDERRHSGQSFSPSSDGAECAPWGRTRPSGRALAQTGSRRPRLILSSSFREGARGENSQSWHLYKFVPCIFENGCVWAQTL